MKKLKSATTSTSLITLILLVLIIGITYAYFSGNLIENNKTETIVKSNVLNVMFKGGKEINFDNIIPGDIFTKTFSVENTSNSPIKYNIYMEKITNEFNEDLVYSLTNDNDVLINETELPKTSIEKKYLITAVNIPANQKNNYILKIEYKYLDTPQNDYQNALFKTTVGIDSNFNVMK